MITKALNPGDRVTYLAFPGSKYEHGIVKSIHPTNPQLVFVVYRCGGNWDRYADYTAAATDVASLEHGWLPNKPIDNSRGN